MYKKCKGNSEEEEAMVMLVAMLPALIYKRYVNVDANIQAAVCIRVAGRSKVSRKSA